MKIVIHLMSVPIICKSKGLVSSFPHMYTFFEIMDIFFNILFRTKMCSGRSYSEDGEYMYCNELLADWTIEM